MLYREKDVLVFSNGMIGCVTSKLRLALVDKSGWTAKPHNMPLLSEYLKRNSVVQMERPINYDDQLEMAA